MMRQADTMNYDAWLEALVEQGYDRDWIRRNEGQLRITYRNKGGQMLPPCPAPPAPRNRDRYEEL